jgi:DNA-binding MarR family transcriptional regulator
VSKQLSRHNPASDDFVKEEFPFYWIARLNNIYHHHMERALHKVGADLPTWRILFILRENGTSTMSEISLHAVVKLPTITKIVYRLQERGLVSASTSATDGRVTEVSLTPIGLDAITEMRKVTESVFLKGYEGLTPVKIERLNKMLMQVFDNLDHY